LSNSAKIINNRRILNNAVQSFPAAFISISTPANGPKQQVGKINDDKTLSRNN
jgi:hypothetical protein